VIGKASRLTSLANACAFAIAILVGVTAGYLLTAGEQMEAKYRGGKRGAVKQNSHR
jgi:hypothetical protein